MNPLTIYQDALNIVSDAVLSGDFDRYAGMIDLPYLIHTDTGRTLSSTKDELTPAFLAVHKLLKARGVTHYERVAREADYVARHRITGWHFTYHIADGSYLAPPHKSRLSLVQRADRWLFSEAHYATRASAWPVPELDLGPVAQVRP
jgi:hypothetical protein